MTVESITGQAIDRIQALVKNAEGFTIHTTTPPSGVEGLPQSFPIGMDHRANQNGQGPFSLRKFAEEWRLFPERRRGTATVTTLESFIRLATYHRTSTTAVFADTGPRPSLTCVLDYHPTAAGDPEFCEHRVTYNFPLSDEFQAWSGQDGKTMDQGEFAAWVEEHIADLAEANPEETANNEALFRTKTATPGHMIELSRGLLVNVDSVMKNAVVLQTGEASMIFEEEHKDSAGGKLIVPGMFMVAIPIFVGGTPVRIPVRLRYRASRGKVSWFFQLFRWKAEVRGRILADLDMVADAGFPTYEGAPERS